MAERVGFEPTIRFWRILTFQASAFDHSATAPHCSGSARPSGTRCLAQGVKGWHKRGMKHNTAFVALALLAAPLNAEEPAKPVALAPVEIVAAAPAKEWTAIPASDLLIMDLAADAKGKPRRVVIQLMPAPFSAGWIGNIRKLAAAHWWDGTSVNRVQDNYVVQWGDASEKKALPKELGRMLESEYETSLLGRLAQQDVTLITTPVIERPKLAIASQPADGENVAYYVLNEYAIEDPGIKSTGFSAGFPVGYELVDSPPDISQNAKLVGSLWPVHCYGMVGVGRDMPPNTGTGAELYTVIGHAPRHLDRNIALVGRVIEGIEHLSALPRGTGALGFYETAEERVPIRSVRLGNDVKELPKFEYLSTTSTSFAAYAEARANRRDAFFIRPAGGADICNIPVPVRRAKP